MSEKNSSDRVQMIFRLDRELKSRWDSTCGDRKISQDKAGLALVEWFVSLDAVAQAMIFGQIPASDDLKAMVIRQLQAEPPRAMAAKKTEVHATPKQKH